jgi:prephenate dehydratase
METVGYLGPGTAGFGFAAAQAFCGAAEADYRAFESHAGAYRALANGQIGLAVLAIENAIAGVVDEAARLMVDGAVSGNDVRVVGEIAVPVELSLMAQGDDWQTMTHVASHDMALRQCSRLLDGLFTEFAHLRPMRCESTAAAARLAAVDKRIAALASPRALAESGLCELAARAEDKQPNQTRFLVLARCDHPRAHSLPSLTDKSLVLFELARNRPGSLAAALSCFAAQGVCLSLIHSCPRLDRDWEYIHLLEYEQNAGSAAMQAALRQVAARHLCQPRVLGSYRNVTTATLALAGQTWPMPDVADSPGREHLSHPTWAPWQAASRCADDHLFNPRQE